MITDINRKKIIFELNREKSPSYWSKYFEFEDDIELYDLTKNELIKAIEAEKKEDRPYLDSGLVISKLLIMFGEKNMFHRQFREKHTHSNREQVLGMQLYHIMLNDDNVWIYCPTKKSGHLFSNATYFK